MLKANLVRVHTRETTGSENLKSSDPVKEKFQCGDALAHQDPEYIEN